MTKEIARWGDAAMFQAEPMEQTSPKVYLISMSADPLGEIASCAKMYKGEVVRSLSEVTDAERESYFDDMTKTILGAPFEAVKFHFMIEGVTRAFTHQLVRQRTAVYFQESMRFAVIDESFAGRVGLPPSLQGTVPWSEFAQDMHLKGVDPNVNASAKQYQRKNWDETIDHTEAVYKGLVEDGMPAEEARGLLPTNILTRVHYITDLRNLVGHAGLRLCTQAQFEWRHVFSQIANAIRNAKTHLPGDSGLNFPVHMADRISDTLFRPVCYSTGKCEFMASFDRACSIRDRVQMNHAIGRPSSEWDRSYVSPSGTEDIGPIQPAEWLVNDAAARS